MRKLGFVWLALGAAVATAGLCACAAEREAGEEGCTIGSSVVPSGAINPENPCRWCDPSVSEDGWSDRGGPDCDNGCVIGSYLVPGGTVNPENPCRWCDPSLSKEGWSDRDGAACDDGLFCTTEDLCGGGACAGAPKSCSDDVACNGEEICDEETDACLPGVSECGPTEDCDLDEEVCVPRCVHCSIDGSCYYDFQSNPQNPCQICNMELDRFDWSNSDGVACDDGASCNGTDMCASGSCSIHQGIPCADDLFCNGVEVCDEATDTCAHPNDACTDAQTCFEEEDRCCEAQDQLGCNADHDVAWIDSCGRVGAVAESCPDAPNGSCEAGACFCLPGWTGEGCGRCVIYVKPDGDDAKSGGSWSDAVASVSAGISLASGVGCEVWVAEGTYVPHASNRAVSFQMVGGVDLYGGFTGTETTLAERDVAAHPTILSGEIGDPGVATDNTFHVVVGASQAVLDGFTVAGGSAASTDPGQWSGCGAGMLVAYTSPTVRNCTFRDNQADYQGGGVYLEESSATLRHCRFEQNHGRIWGGGLMIAQSSIRLAYLTFIGNQSTAYGGGMAIMNGWGDTASCANCTFEANTCPDQGGALYARGGTVQLANALFHDNAAETQDYAEGGAVHIDGNTTFILRNATITGNRSGGWGGGITAWGPLVVTNSIIWGNTAGEPTATLMEQQLHWGDFRPYIRYSVVAGEELFPGDGNKNADPLFINADPESGTVNLNLQSVSPAIDAGFAHSLLPDVCDIDEDGDTEESTPMDLDCDPRLAGNEVDMGAFERR